MTDPSPEIPAKQAPQPHSSWTELFLNRADQVAFSILWVAVIIGCGWYFVSARGLQPIDIDEAGSRSNQFQVAINSASKHEFACLPGIGEKTAAAIIAHREQHGPFESIDSMTEVPRVSPRLLDKVRSFLYLEPLKPEQHHEDQNDK